MAEWGGGLIFQDNRLSATPSELLPLEEETLATLGGKSMAWSGRAATGLYWAYQIARHTGKPVDIPEVIVPAISCTTPATVALPAGCRVRFADVDPFTGMVTLDSVRARWTPSTRAVVFIHLYGQTADLEPLANWCHSQGVLLIEDLAQAQGARFPNGSVAGSSGDMTVYSFNATKILECGGGALVLRSSDLADAWRDIAQAQAACPEIDTQSAAVLSLSQRNLYHSLISLRRMRSGSDVSRVFLPVQEAYFGLYVRSMKSAAAVATAWNELPHLLAARSDKAAVYSSKLAHGPWRLLDGWVSSGVCWRYSLLVDFPEKLVAFTEAVRRDGFYVSNLYWPLNDLMNPQDVCPNADSFARRVVNLWVDGTVDLEWIGRCSESLCKHAVEHTTAA